jgi:hypothetical protein
LQQLKSRIREKPALVRSQAGYPAKLHKKSRQTPAFSKQT